MTQNAEKVIDHFELFRGQEYKDMFANKKKNFEYAVPAEEVQKQVEYAKSWEYREKNFAREALTVNPAKACQPLGAVFAAVGFEGTIPFVHGSQGCVAYYRSHFSRHFKEPTSCVSSSMTEDAAVFGGLNNMIDGLANSYSLYKPKMIAVSTTCMAEVIGDDALQRVGAQPAGVGDAVEPRRIDALRGADAQPHAQRRQRQQQQRGGQVAQVQQAQRGVGHELHEVDGGEVDRHRRAGHHRRQL